MLKTKADIFKRKVVLSLTFTSWNLTTIYHDFLGLKLPLKYLS